MAREIEIAGIAAARFRVPNGSWIVVPLSSLARAYSVTDDRPGRDVAFIDIDNMIGTRVWFVCWDAVAQGTGNPEASVADFTNPAPQNGTEGVGFEVAGNAVYTLDKVRNLTHISLYAPASHHGEVQISLSSYKTDSESPLEG